MRRIAHITPQFVEFVPKELEAGILYISETYGTASHLCACGCGARVVTPLTPIDWRFDVHEQGVSLYPSIGNSDFPCGSHYWIKEGEIEWVPKWTRAEIDAGRRFDRMQKAIYFGEQEAVPGPRVLRVLWRRLMSLFRRGDQ